MCVSARGRAIFVCNSAVYWLQKEDPPPNCPSSQGLSTKKRKDSTEGKKKMWPPPLPQHPYVLFTISVASFCFHIGRELPVLFEHQYNTLWQIPLLHANVHKVRQRGEKAVSALVHCNNKPPEMFNECLVIMVVRHHQTENQIIRFSHDMAKKPWAIKYPRVLFWWLQSAPSFRYFSSTNTQADSLGVIGKHCAMGGDKSGPFTSLIQECGETNRKHVWVWTKEPSGQPQTGPRTGKGGDF